MKSAAKLKLAMGEVSAKLRIDIVASQTFKGE